MNGVKPKSETVQENTAAVFRSVKERGSKFDEAGELFQRHGGLLRTSEALRLGIHPEILYALRDAGILDRVSRGLYRLKGLPPLTTPDVVTVAKRIPEGVVCLLSSLAFHDLTSQILHEVYVAIARDMMRPSRLEWPPIRVFKFGKSAFFEGIESHTVDDIQVRIYSPEKTLADCFKFRNKIGIDVAIEALKLYRERRKIKPDDILRYARICRVERVMKPYLEAIL
jgi:predicted transcriptional regulator of viral defense system